MHMHSTIYSPAQLFMHPQSIWSLNLIALSLVVMIIRGDDEDEDEDGDDDDDDDAVMMMWWCHDVIMWWGDNDHIRWQYFPTPISTTLIYKLMRPHIGQRGPSFDGVWMTEFNSWSRQDVLVLSSYQYHSIIVITSLSFCRGNVAIVILSGHNVIVTTGVQSQVCFVAMFGTVSA